MKIIIIGAGIGGSALALALEQFNLDYVLLEQAPGFKEVGAGIQLSPNGVQILERLGLTRQLAEFCTTPAAHRYSVWDTGETILTTPLMPKVLDTYGYAYYHAHRADLIAALTATLNTDRLRLNTQVQHVGQNTNHVWVDLADGSREHGDLLIGADGVHSVVREQIFKPDLPRRSGYVTWRGVVDAEKIAHLDIPMCAHVDMGPALSFVYYYVSGGNKFNWLALGEASGNQRESWSQTSSREDVLAAFDGWYDRPKRLIEATDETFVTALYDRNPLTNWVSNRIALMGDAAHAMLPYHAQGAVQSLEDAWVLAACLRAHEMPSALRRYQDLRADRAQRVVDAATKNARNYHIAFPPLRVAAHGVLGLMGHLAPGAMLNRFDWLYGHDVTRIDV